MGRAPAARLFRVVLMLPMESATKAMIRADPSPGGGKTPPAWLGHYGDEPTVSVLRDIWDAIVAGNNASKKKSPTYPRPKREKRPTRRSQPE